jgi:signal transduction histidine kinase
VYKNREGFLLGQVHEDDKRLVEKSLAIVKTGEPFQYRYRFYHKSGMTLWLETRTVPIYDSSLSDYIALSITLDVTSAVLNQLQIEERNRDLNEFTYMVSHDLKNPINTIKGMIGLIQAEPSIQTNRTLEQAAAYITSAAVRLEDLTDGVLKLARVSASERTLEPVDLNDVMDEVVHDFKHQLERASGTITTIEELPVVLGNRTQLYQIFSNLVGNAIKYRSTDRPLIISVGPEKAPSRRKASIAVRDNGRGIAPDHIDEIFKPFHRTSDDTISGVGVGLACVQRLASRLGGSVGVESTEGEGSMFTVTLRRSPN